MAGREVSADSGTRVIAVDQGTTATKAYTLDLQGRLNMVAHIEHEQILPRRGWVEHDPEVLLANLRHCIAEAGTAAALGIDNQGETVVAWDARTGRPVYNAIVWQDMCQALLEGIALRAAQVIAAMDGETGASLEVSIDGGLSRNGYFRQFLANALNREIAIPPTPDATSLGTAWIAMLGAGLVAVPGDLPDPAGFKTQLFPKVPVTATHHALFAEAVERASGWWNFSSA